MKIKLKDIKITDENSQILCKLRDNSYSEWINDWDSEKKEFSSWELTLEITDENRSVLFTIDSENDFLSFVDLDGFLTGEEFFFSENYNLKMASHSSNILLGIVFSESIKHKYIDENEIDYFGMYIFPEWSRGLIPNDIFDNEEIKEFFEENLKKLIEEKKLVLFDIDTEELECDNEDVNIEEFKKYFKKDLFFYSVKD